MKRWRALIAGILVIVVAVLAYALFVRATTVGEPIAKDEMDALLQDIERYWNNDVKPVVESNWGFTTGAGNTTQDTPDDYAYWWSLCYLNHENTLTSGFTSVLPPSFSTAFKTGWNEAEVKAFFNKNQPTKAVKDEIKKLGYNNVSEFLTELFKMGRYPNNTALLKRDPGKEATYAKAKKMFLAEIHLFEGIYTQTPTSGGATQSSKDKLVNVFSSDAYKNALECMDAMDEQDPSGTARTTACNKAVDKALSNHGFVNFGKLRDFLKTNAPKSYSPQNVQHMNEVFSDWQDMVGITDRSLDPMSKSVINNQQLDLPKVLTTYYEAVTENCTVCNGSGNHVTQPPDDTPSYDTTSAYVELHYGTSYQPVTNTENKTSIAASQYDGIKFLMYENGAVFPESYSYVGTSLSPGATTPAMVADTYATSQGTASGSIDNLLQRFSVYTAGLIYANANKLTDEDRLVEEDTEGAYAKADVSGDDVYGIWLDMASSGLDGVLAENGVDKSAVSGSTTAGDRFTAIQTETADALATQAGGKIDEGLLGFAVGDSFGFKSDKPAFMSLAPTCSGTSGSETLAMHRRFQTQWAVNAAIMEYYVYASVWRHNTQSNVADYKNDAGVQDILVYLNNIQNTFGQYYPILQELWMVSDGDFVSLKDMLDPAREDDVPDLSATTVTETEVDEDSILSRFYTISVNNSSELSVPLVGIDRVSVVNDVEVNPNDTTEIDEVMEAIENSDGQVNVFFDPDENPILSRGESGLINAGAWAWNHGGSEVVQNVNEAIDDVSGVIDDTFGENTRILTNSVPGMDSEGTFGNGISGEMQAVNYKAVTLSDNIVKGMAYSVSYVPMQTNLYTQNVIDSYDEEFKDQFFNKYGYMRKALMYDTSSTSVVDYYNANDTLTGQLDVVTLRDLIEMGDNDIALYIDDDFYNAEEAIENGNTELQAIYTKNEELAQFLMDYYYTFTAYDSIKDIKDEDDKGMEMYNVLQSLSSGNQMFVYLLTQAINNGSDPDVNDLNDYLYGTYKFDASGLELEDMLTEATDLSSGVNVSKGLEITEKVLKHGDYTTYDYAVLQALKSYTGWYYRQAEAATTDSAVYAAGKQDNKDTIVLPSSLIKRYLDSTFYYETKPMEGDDGSYTAWQYTVTSGYSPMMSLAYVSAMYRSEYYTTLADLTTNDNPVFLASDDLCGIQDVTQWHANSIINYAFVKNLPSACQINYNYVIDLDNPLYIDIFGNIQTESGTVVVPAACNMTLHTGKYKESNVGMGLYFIYGKDYKVPMTCRGASKGLFPFFALDTKNECYVVNGSNVSLGTSSVKFNEMDLYASEVHTTLEEVYASFIKKEAGFTRLNWIAMVNIINEVMRGAPISAIDKGKEGLGIRAQLNAAAITVAVKLEDLIKSLKSSTENTLIAIPDISQLGSMEYLVAFFIKMLIVGTCGVIIVGIYQDGVAGNLGLNTVTKSLWAVALTFISVVVIPLVFQATYYSANKLLLQKEAYRILMLNTEKYESGIEVGMTDTHSPERNNDMAVQIDWISVPWYDELEYMLYDATLSRMSDVKKQAYQQSVVHDHMDVKVHNDGVYVETDTLFDSVDVDFTFTPDENGMQGLYLHANQSLQTASWYMPYYVFLEALVQDVNSYNYHHGTYSYTTKYMSGNRLKTVGLTSTYFNSQSFAELAPDILHLYEIYGLTQPNYFDVDPVFARTDNEVFMNSFWYNNSMTPEQVKERIGIMNEHCRRFIAENGDMLSKLTDETFLKVYALAMAIEYNQLFNVTSANAIDMYNLTTDDLLRLCIDDVDTAVLASPMSFARYVYSFGGFTAVIAMAFLEIILFVGSWVKPIATLIVWLVVFLSIYVHRVVLRRKEEHGLVGYLVTVLLLCATNFAHALLLKAGTALPGICGSVTICIFAMCVIQIAYLTVLALVVSNALRHWRDLGGNQYMQTANNAYAKVTGQPSRNLYNGGVHHENPWDYYNDFKTQYRQRNSRFSNRMTYGYSNTYSQRNVSPYGNYSRPEMNPYYGRRPSDNITHMGNTYRQRQQQQRLFDSNQEYDRLQQQALYESQQLRNRQPDINAVNEPEEVERAMTQTYAQQQLDVNRQHSATVINNIRSGGGSVARG